MLAGLPYDSRDPELLEIYFNARRVIRKISMIDPSNQKAITAHYKSLFGYMGDNVWIESPFYCDFGENISIGDGSFINMNCVFLDTNKITLGKSVLIAPAVQLYTASHPISPSERIINDGKSYVDVTAPITVGDRVWIGGGAIVLPGVTIGEGSTIGAGSVVTKDVPPFVLAAGNPCRVIRSINPD